MDSIAFFVRRTVERAFQLWSDQIGIPSMRTVQLAFQEARNSEEADINILWATGIGLKYPACCIFHH